MKSPGIQGRPTTLSRAGATFAIAWAALICVACSSQPPRPGPESRTLRLDLPVELPSLDPHFQDEVFAYSVLSNIYESLVDFDAEMQVVPQLAESWENPDDLTWIFHLRAGVTFHDGRPLTAARVCTSLERAQTNPRSQVASYLGEVAEARAVDDLTVLLTTHRPDPILLNKLPFIFVVPETAEQEIAQPVGTGPYRFTRKLVDGAIELVRYEPYWDGRPWVERAQLRSVSGVGPRVARLRAGQSDVATHLGPAGAASARVDPALRVITRESLDVVYLQFRVDEPPFDDRRVREAVHRAVDRVALVRELARDHGHPIGQMVGRHVSGYVSDLGVPDRDVELARRLLADAGYQDGIDVTLEYRPTATAEALQRQLAEAGIRVRLAPQAWRELYPRMRAGEVPFYLGAWISSSADASDLFESKLHTPVPASGYGVGNSSGYSNPELDRMVGRARTTLQVRARQELLAACMRLVTRDLPLVPLFTPDQVLVVRDRFAVLPRVDGRLLVKDVRPAVSR